MKMLKTLLPSNGYLDDCEMVDAELRAISCGIKSIPEWVQDRFSEDDQWRDINELTFFYHPVADAVVLNRDHPHYDLYELLVTAYMKSDEETQKKLRDNIPVDTIRNAIDTLGFILEERSRQCQTLSATF